MSFPPELRGVGGAARNDGLPQASPRDLHSAKLAARLSGGNLSTRPGVRSRPACCSYVPDFALGVRTASLSLAFYEGKLFPIHYQGGAFVGRHGAWNRKPPSGCKVVFVPFSAGQPTGLPEDVLTGFLNADGDALGRPVGVAIDPAGALLVADDVGSAIWRVTPTSPK